MEADPGDAQRGKHRRETGLAQKLARQQVVPLERGVVLRRSAAVDRAEG